MLSINRYEQDILLKNELDQLVERHSERLKVTYSLTGDNVTYDFHQGRGDVALARKSLPDPSLENVMVFVCGKDGFVDHWGGKIEREKTTDGSKGKKVQGPLKGILRDAGYDASQVFKY